MSGVSHILLQQSVKLDKDLRRDLKRQSVSPFGLTDQVLLDSSSQLFNELFFKYFHYTGFKSQLRCHKYTGVSLRGMNLVVRFTCFPFYPFPPSLT